MGFTIDIDTGGTFTDGFFTFEDQMQKVKVDTTPHDFTECFLNCIKAGAQRFDLSLRELLKQTAVVRFSCTIGTNSLIQKAGPKIGLIVTKGNEKLLYGAKGAGAATDTLISKDMVLGVQNSVDKGTGKPPEPINEPELMRAVRELLEKGARVLVISLKGSYWDGSQEKEIKDLIMAEYPRHYLGSVPVLLASEVSFGREDYLRTNTVLTNAYLHPEMVRVLYKAEEDLRRHYYNKPLMIVHANGGVARVAKTKAIDTHNSGPVAGLMGALFMSRLYNLENIITIDIGGTSSDVGLILKGETELSPVSNIAGIPINVPVFHIHSVGAGGGSIAAVDSGSKALEVGPQSAGALPGPACYDLGGYLPAATDADVVLGFIDPDYFLGGLRRLNKEKATEAIQYDVADLLGESVEQTAFQIHNLLAKNAAREIETVLKDKGLSTEGFVLFAFGGAGGAYACEIARILKIAKIYTFQQNSVFSAFGSSVMDVLHIYEKRSTISFIGTKKLTSPFEESFNEIVNGLQERAETDMRGEGFEPKDIDFTLELDISVKGLDREIAVISPVLQLTGEAEARLLLQEAQNKCQALGLSEAGQLAHFTISMFRLKTTASIPHFKPSSSPPAAENPKGALKGKRPVYWGKGYTDTDVYERARLKSGQVVLGPAIIEAEDTTYVLPTGWRFKVDTYLNGIIEETK